MLEHALAYAARGWRVFPVGGALLRRSEKLTGTLWDSPKLLALVEVEHPPPLYIPLVRSHDTQDAVPDMRDSVVR